MPTSPLLLATGAVGHHRLQPLRHGFRYPVAFVELDVEQAAPWLDALPFCRWRAPALVRFHRGDYFGAAARPLSDCVREYVGQALTVDTSGPVRLLTTLRMGGHAFNPVSFYRTHATDGTPTAVLAEITNTPWNERHSYLIPLQSDDRGGCHGRLRCRKAFHVSPFNSMDQWYHWCFDFADDQVRIHMQNEEDDRVVFTAGMQLRLRPLTPHRWLRALVRAPCVSLQTLWRIYHQAWRLQRHGAPVYDHPKYATPHPDSPREVLA